MKNLFFFSLPISVLLAYSGLIKGLDVHLFQTQLGKSPLIPPVLIVLISYIVPAVELIIATGFFSDRYFKWSAYASFTLMSFFSFYLIALVTLFPSDSIPCSCGGVLGNMGYPIHIAFNIFFTLLAGYICLQIQGINSITKVDQRIL